MKKLLVCFIAVAISIGFGMTPVMAQNDEDPHLDGKYAPHMYVDPGGIGDLLLFSLYDVRPVDGRGPLWENYIAIENTSGRWTAFHLRFRAWKKSIEVFDHVILLSPYDVFWMSLTLAPDPATGPNDGLTTYPCSSCTGGFEPYELEDVLMYSGDKHTLYNSALIYEDLDQEFWLDKFQDSMLIFNGFDSDDGRAPKSELQAGYIEVIGLWSLSIPASVDPTNTSDVHELSAVVTDVHPDPPEVEGTINVHDALDALFYRFFTGYGAIQAGYFGAPAMNPPGYPAGHAVYDCRDAANFVGCWTQYPINQTGPTNLIDSAWPDFAPTYWQWDGNGGPANVTAINTRTTPYGNVVRIERVTNGGLGDQNIPFVTESPGATRFGEDCGNVLTGNVAFGDPLNGKYQLENFIAVRNFRSDIFEDKNWLHSYYTSDEDLDSVHCGLQPEFSNWAHRDGFAGGGIFFPSSISKWYYKVANWFTGGAAETYLWYYVNPDYSTAGGPILHDGNDLVGLNFNDVNHNNAEWLDSDFNPAITNYGLTRPFPLNSAGPENNVYSFVHYFNDIWSLDDLEVALAKYEIWYTHLRTRVTEGAKGNLDTDVVLTYPTKHGHYFFTDWPFMFRNWMGYCENDEDPGTLTSRVGSGDVLQFWANLLEYRGNGVALFPELQGSYAGVKSVEQLKKYTSNSSDAQKEDLIMPEFNNTVPYQTIAQWFQSKWSNGRIYVQSHIWDNEQNRPSGDPPLPPPGSPWYPTPVPPKWAPHEVNIVRAGLGIPAWNPGPAGTINDLNWLLAAATGDFGKGHFRIDQSYLAKGQRSLYDYHEDLEDAFTENEWQHSIYNAKGTTYLIPPIGLVIYNHDFGTSQDGVTRSAMAEWHYLQDWMEIDTCKMMDECDDDK